VFTEHVMNYVAKNDVAKNSYINKIAKFSKNVNLPAVIDPIPEIHTNKTCFSKYLRKICMFIFLCTTLYMYTVSGKKWNHSILPLTLPSDLPVNFG